MTDTSRTFITLLVSALILFSCSTKNQFPQDAHIPPHFPDTPSAAEPLQTVQDKNLSIQRQIIVQHTLENLGKPYAWGGASPEKGFDCSGLVAFTHGRANLNVPRTTSAQMNSGRPIVKSAIRPADLVFFNNPAKNKTLHVGIYIGDNLFVHAPGRGRQVTHADLNNPYFKKNYIGARSFIEQNL